MSSKESATFLQIFQKVNSPGLFSVSRCIFTWGIQKRIIFSEKYKKYKIIFLDDHPACALSVVCDKLFDPSPDNPKKTAQRVNPGWFVHIHVASQQPRREYVRAF